MKLRFYCDGSSGSRRGQPIGWAWILISIDEDGVGKPIHYGQNSHSEGTNNIAELSAIRDAIQYLWSTFSDFEPYGGVEVVSDSQYALGAAAGINAVHSNQELVADIRRMVKGLPPDFIIHFLWTPGHVGEFWQEKTDTLAVQAKEAMKASLQKENQ